MSVRGLIIFFAQNWTSDQSQIIGKFSGQKKTPSKEGVLPRTGLEPARHYWHKNLNLECLPFHHLGMDRYLNRNILKIKSINF